MSSLKNPRSLFILAILLLAVAIAPSVQSYPTGITGAQDGGCSCHGGGVASDDVVPILEGVPVELEAGATYTLNISFTGGPSFSENTISNVAENACAQVFWVFFRARVFE